MVPINGFTDSYSAIFWGRCPSNLFIAIGLVILCPENNSAPEETEILWASKQENV